jgi:squalene-hopene/tetraprenyl-beta-curcumene cyclase
LLTAKTFLKDHSMLQRTLHVALVAAIGFSVGISAFAAEGVVTQKEYEQMVAKAINYLATKGQAPDGSYSAAASPAITALVTAGILQNGRTPEDPLVAKSLKYLEGFVQPDGGIYKEGTFHKNYETSMALICFAKANRNGKYDQLIKRAEGFLKGIQWDESDDKKPSEVEYGGAGYGRSKRPDLSNTSFFLDALKAAGNDENSEAIQRALIFVSRCQNLESEHNSTPFPVKNPDGGFYYTPAGGGNSQAGETDNGGLRSYASMTYAGLKSMIYAGVGPEDKRVKAALAWLKKNYDLDENPGMGQSGLFYYYHTFAKALDAVGGDTFVDAQGVKHHWRQELLAELKKQQRDDGSWVNDQSRWMEGDANLVTGYVLLTLPYVQPKK